MPREFANKEALLEEIVSKLAAISWFGAFAGSVRSNYQSVIIKSQKGPKCCYGVFLKQDTAPHPIKSGIMPHHLISHLPVGLRKLAHHILHPCHFLYVLQNSEISVEFPLRWADLTASEKFASMKEALLSSTWMQITTEIAS